MATPTTSYSTGGWRRCGCVRASLRAWPMGVRRLRHRTLSHLQKGFPMFKSLDHLRPAHRFLAQHAFYSLVLSSALACAVLATRIRLSHSLAYVFLVWNLFLAWAPYGWSLAAAAFHRRHPAAWWRLLAPAALWLLF